MSLPILAGSVIAALLVAYRVYGRLVAAQYRLDDGTVTPAVELCDGVDYEPTPPFYLFGQHFSAIAAAGPIVGPIAACLQFGWLPCLLWIVLGGIFIGAVHDFSALVASVRHQARSIAEIVKENLSRRAWVALMCFIWLALIYVIVAFTDVTASTFLGRIEELDGVQVGFNAGGAVAFASVTYLSLAIAMGLWQRFGNPPLWLLTAIFVPATLAAVWLGTQFSDVLALQGPSAQKTWGAILLVYCFVASLLPVWMLLQPRGYLGGFVLYLVLAAGVIGVFAGGFTVAQPAFKGFEVGGLSGSLFPFLFVTIACGACSGFHGLVCGGTTSKQIARETHCHPVAIASPLNASLAVRDLLRAGHLPRSPGSSGRTRSSSRSDRDGSRTHTGVPHARRDPPLLPRPPPGIPPLAELHRLEERYGGRLGIMAKNLGTGEVVRYRADERFPTASVIKLPIMAAYFHLVAQGKVEANQRVELTAADKKPDSGLAAVPRRGCDHIAQGCGAADDRAERQHRDEPRARPPGARRTTSGSPPSIDLMAAQGLKNTRLLNRLYSWDTKKDTPEAIRYGIGVSTAEDMVLLMEQLHAGTLVDSASCKEMLDILRRSVLHRHDPAVPARERVARCLTVAHKTGGINETKVDVGLILSDRAHHRDRGLRGQASRTTANAVDNQAVLLAAHASRVAWNALTGDRSPIDQEGCGGRRGLERDSRRVLGHLPDASRAVPASAAGRRARGGRMGRSIRASRTTSTAASSSWFPKIPHGDRRGHERHRPLPRAHERQSRRPGADDDAPGARSGRRSTRSWCSRRGRTGRAIRSAGRWRTRAGSSGSCAMCWRPCRRRAS